MRMYAKNSEGNFVDVKNVSLKQHDPNAAVDSVNGKKGDVILNAEDVGALSSDTFIPTKPSDIKAQPEGNYASVEDVKKKAEIDDNLISTDKVLSSKKTYDQLLPEFTKSGSIVSCNPVEGYPLHVISKISIEQDGNGDPSPENVRNFIPCSQLKLERTKKNLIKWTDMKLNHAVWNDDHTQIIANQNNNYYCELYLTDDNGINFIKKNKNYFVMVNGDVTPKRYISCILYGEFSDEESYFATTAVWGKNKIMFKVPNTLKKCTTLTIRFNGSNDPIVDNSSKFFDISFSFNNSNKYEPYYHEEIVANFQDPIYGGSLDWNTGKFENRNKLWKFDGSLDENWNRQENFWYTIFDKYPNKDYSYIPERSNSVCNTYKYGNRLNGGFWVTEGDVNFLPLNPENFDSEEKWRNYLKEHPIEVIIPMETINTLNIDVSCPFVGFGADTLYTNTGDTTVVGRTIAEEAWEPKQESYELIEKITSTEAKIFNRSKESDGTPYCFKDLIIKASSDLGFGGYGHIIVSTKDSGLIEDRVAFITVSDSEKRVYLIVKKENNVLISMGGSTNIYSNGLFDVSSTTFADEFPRVDSFIKSLQISFEHVSDESNLEIEIWAVRA